MALERACCNLYSLVKQDCSARACIATVVKNTERYRFCLISETSNGRGRRNQIAPWVAASVTGVQLTDAESRVRGGRTG